MRILILFLLSVSCEAQIQGVIGTAPRSQNVYYLTMHGQSNSEGITLVADLDVGLTRQFSNVYIWYNAAEVEGGGAWQKLQAGVNNNRASRLIYYGAEIAIADLFETTRPNDVLYISKYAVGSSAVGLQGSIDWNASSTNESLDKALEWWDIPALAAIPYPNVINLGMIWMQGEQDADNATLSVTATFLTNTSNMLAEYRTRIGFSVTVYVCRLNAAITRDAGQLANVRTAQGTAAGNLGDTGTFPNNVFFNTDSYALIDAVHFEQLQYGEDLYNLLFTGL